MGSSTASPGCSTQTAAPTRGSPVRGLTVAPLTTSRGNRVQVLGNRGDGPRVASPAGLFGLGQAGLLIDAQAVRRPASIAASMAGA